MVQLFQVLQICSIIVWVNDQSITFTFGARSCPPPPPPRMVHDLLATRFKFREDGHSLSRQFHTKILLVHTFVCALDQISKVQSNSDTGTCMVWYSTS